MGVPLEAKPVNIDCKVEVFFLLPNEGRAASTESLDAFKN